MNNDFTTTSSFPARSTGRGRSAASRRVRGQSLIVAVIVMFVLLFIGGIFVALVARNLKNSGRAKETVSALNLAQAGIAYCDGFLMNSPEGADWRPEPTPLINPQDPDQLWLRDTANPWTRVELQDGRVLVRVTYEPHYITDPSNPAQQILDPLSKRIKIEAIGRVGFLNPADPTTFLNTPAPRLRRELVAYKSIGLTDYLRYVTNKDNDSKMVAELGVPPVGINLPTGYPAAGPKYPMDVQYGGNYVRTFWAPPANYHLPGAPIHVRGSANISGPARFYIDQRNGEAIQVAGTLTVQPHDPNNGAVLIDPVAGSTNPIMNSSDPNYSTYRGMIRDDSPNPDIFGYPRNISGLEPPRLDTPDQQTGITRSRLNTRNSGRFLNGRNTGWVGMGAGMYIDNYNNVEALARRVNGAPSVRSNWLNPNSQYWNASPYYIPPGVYLEFGYPVVQARDATTSELVPDSFVATPGVRVVRDASDPNKWQDLQGNPLLSTNELDFTFFIYKPNGQRPVIKLESEFFRSALRQAPYNMAEKDIDRFLPEFDGVIYAEGNVRTRGLLPSKVNIPIRREVSGEANPLTDAQIRELVSSPAVTVVSGATIYIEGSLLREAADSMIALLATDYVAVNTTMFVGPNQGVQYSMDVDNTVPGNTRVDVAGTARTPPLSFDFLFGDNPAAYVDASNAQVPIQLLARHGTPNGGTYLNIFVNDWAPRAAGNPLYSFSLDAAANPVYYYPMRTGTSSAPAEYEHRPFQLLPKVNKSNYLFTGDAGYTWPQGLRGSFTPRVDVSAAPPGETPQDYLHGRTGVVPMDVRIEAVIYAQNGSFFVIPGYPFNNRPDDTRDAALRRAKELDPLAPAGTMLRPPGIDPFFPFYGEPIDCRITIVGSISENRTASLSDQAAWMQLWGYIPENYGSTGTNPVNAANVRKIPQQHLFAGDVGNNPSDQRTQAEKDAQITRGIRLIYDPALSAPYVNYDSNQRAFRTDGAYYDQANPTASKNVGRVLPPVPRLPVCPGFVYYGETR